MDAEDLKKYRKAGEIAKESREWSRSLVKPGAKVLDIAEKIEQKIVKDGGKIAFPVNVCINDVTAHYTPKYNDTTVLSANDVVSVDLGVHIDGFIADTAYTVDLTGKYGKLLECNQKALEDSIKLVKPGVSVAAVGEKVQSIITKAGYKPIENLTGHEVKQYDLHAGLAVPNIKVPYDWSIQEGMVLALEPFATNGCGRVVEAKAAEIFSVDNDKPTRMREARMLLSELDERGGLPFASRWYSKKINPLKLNLILYQLVAEKILTAYPPLHEKEKGIVSQFEHTIVVTKNGCEVTT